MNARAAFLLVASVAVLPCCTSTPGSESERARDAGVSNPANGDSSAGGSEEADATPPASSSGPPVAGDKPNPSAACGSPARIATGQSERTIESAGVSRRLLVYLPEVELPRFGGQI
jgi:hypothetical protein